jgi:hypothetical protein
VKFICDTEFIHSGGRAYFPGVVYSDIDAANAEKLIAADLKKPLGALSFFTPVDDDAVTFIKTAKRNEGAADPPPPPPPAASGGDGAKPPGRADLVAEAKSLGVKGADRMTVDELKEVIAAKKKPDPPAGGQEQAPSPGEGGGAVTA